jgi:hypothetical protein
MIPDGTISWEMAKPTEAPFADGTRQDCNFYFDGSSFQDPVPYFKSLCDFAAAIYSVKLADFGTWNKGLQIHESSCSFQAGKRYCGKLYFGEQTMSGVTSEDYPLRQGAAQDCIRYENAWPDRTCQDILDSQGITIDKFFALNPAVGADCGGLWPEYSYCVATPDSGDTTALSIDDSHTTKPSKAGPTTPVQIGQPSDCNKWYEVKSGDSCASIANQNGISVDIFYTWNPIVSKDCSTGFWTGYSYCVSTGGSQPQVQLSSTSDPTSTTATPPAPTPNQANNAISGCKTYALAQNGDYCAVSFELIIICVRRTTDVENRNLLIEAASRVRSYMDGTVHWEQTGPGVTIVSGQAITIVWAFETRRWKRKILPEICTCDDDKQVAFQLLVSVYKPFFVLDNSILANDSIPDSPDGVVRAPVSRHCPDQPIPVDIV